MIWASHWKMLSGSEMILAFRIHQDHCGHLCFLDWRSHLVGWPSTSMSSIKGEAIIQLPTPLSPGFCHHTQEPPSQSSSSTITCSCPLESVLNNSRTHFRWFPDFYLSDLFWDLNSFTTNVTLRHPLGGLTATKTQQSQNWTDAPPFKCILYSFSQ